MSIAMFCPNCKGELSKNPKHGVGVFHCPACNGVFFILVTTPPIKAVLGQATQAVAAPTLPLCDSCQQQFPLIQMAFYAHGQFCPACDQARIAATAADSEAGR